MNNTTATGTDELNEIRHKIIIERSRLTNLAMLLEDAGQSKERQAVFDAVRALDQWEKIAKSNGYQSDQ